MSQVRSVAHGLEAGKELFNKLMMVDNADGQKPAIDWESMVDNPAESPSRVVFFDWLHISQAIMKDIEETTTLSKSSTDIYH
jgi:hypothetical protein